MSKAIRSALLPSAAAIGLAAAILGTTSSDAQACPVEPLVGSVCWMATNFCPEGYYTADGRLLPISTNQVLYSLLSNTYGGDGRTNFGLPDLRGRSPVGAGQGVGLTNVALGVKRGAETQTLSLAQMPTHTHAASTSVAPGSGVSLQAVGNNTSASATTPSAGAYLAGVKSDSPDAVNMWSSTMANPVNVGGLSLNLSGITVTNATTGGNQPFSIVPPQQALMPCIAYNGIYPNRP